MRSYCGLPVMPQRQFSPDVDPNRLSLILVSNSKWVNGTVLHYWFFPGPQAEKKVVRDAFRIWKNLGVGLEFQEVTTRDEAEVRIGFVRGDGAWSYVGRDVLGIGRDQRTMNFGWDLTHPGEIDTALHEIGHTLGFPHEHQNPNAGIVWDEEAVYAALAQPPNSWSREKTFHNIIRKIPPDTVQGSNWDPDSVMHYPFGSGLIKAPPAYQSGINPAGGLSARDKQWIKTFYPPLTKSDYTDLPVMKTVSLNIQPAGQMNFLIKPPATRKYQMGTFGTSDTVIALFEDVNGNPRFMAADDDGGEGRNARVSAKLFTGRKYILRVRLYYKDRAGETAVMLW